MDAAGSQGKETRLKCSRLLTSVLLLLSTLVASPADAAWPHEANNANLPVCTATDWQGVPKIVSDGDGGSFITWFDYREDSRSRVYAQRISAAGIPLWQADGVRICMAGGPYQDFPLIVSDGAGGAIISWLDNRDRDVLGPSIYAQRVNAAGQLRWPSDGVRLGYGNDFGEFYLHDMVSDGAGGAVVAWPQSRDTTGIYAQRVDSSGMTRWADGGVVVRATFYNFQSPALIEDGTGGCIVLCTETGQVYAQRINGEGVRVWPESGVYLGTPTGSQYKPNGCPSGLGGTIITWLDYSGGAGIYAQRLDAAGQPAWEPGGVSLGAVQGSIYGLSVTPDGMDGAIVAWKDPRLGADDVRAQRITSTGVPSWTANGLLVCPGTRTSWYPSVCPDGEGGALVAWDDLRGGPTRDIYAQRIDSDGVPLWPLNGLAVCSSPADQYDPQIASDGRGGAILTWYDARSGPKFDVYAQRVDRFGKLGDAEPAITQVLDVPGDQGGQVALTWSASYLDSAPTPSIAEYWIWRAITSGGGAPTWEQVATQPATQAATYTALVATDRDSMAGPNPRTWFRVEARASATSESPSWSSAPDSGYSVDNIPPAAPAPLSGQYVAGTTSLHWNRNLEADLAGYRLYRGASMAFVPSPDNLVEVLPDTSYVDAAGAPHVYKLTAIDVHGNESPVAMLVPSGTLAVEGAPAAALSFAAPNPNPARGATSLRYTLSRAGHVSLAVYDAAGRRVQLLRDAEQLAGAHETRFALRDDAGRALPSGLYLVRLEAEGRVLTRRLSTIR